METTFDLDEGHHVPLEPVLRAAARRGPILVHGFTEGKPPSADGEEAEIQWGSGASFNANVLQEEVTVTRDPEDLDELDSDGDGTPDSEDDTPFGDGGTTIGDDKELEQPLHEFVEVARNVEDIRVENPDDPTQYVIVQRINWVIFEGPKWSQRNTKDKTRSPWDFSGLDTEESRKQDRRNKDRYKFVFNNP